MMFHIQLLAIKRLWKLLTGECQLKLVWQMWKTEEIFKWKIDIPRSSSSNNNEFFMNAIVQSIL